MPAPLRKPATKVAAATDKAAQAGAPSLSKAKERAAGMSPLDPTKDSDLSMALREMITGGTSRQEVLHRVRANLEQSTTRNGRTKPASTIMNHALNRAEAHGYRVVSTWKLERIPGYVEPERPAPAPRKIRDMAALREATNKRVKGVKKLTKAPASAPVSETPAPAPKAPLKKLGIRKLTKAQ